MYICIYLYIYIFELFYSLVNNGFLASRDAVNVGGTSANERGDGRADGRADV